MMHACGRDTHMAAFIGTARRLAAMKDQWSGTLVMILQPGEETGERPQCDLLLELYCKALERHGKTGFIASAFPELLPESARSSSSRSSCV